jgi:hypothetical protein
LGAVRTLECGHVAHESPSKVCPHLARPEDAEISHVRLLTGRRLEYDLACDACDAAGTPITLVRVCEGCVGRRNEDAEYGELSGWRGQPGIDERPEPVDRTVLSWALPRTARQVIDLAAGGTDGIWLALTAKGAIVALEPEAERCTVLATRLLIAEPGHKPWAGHPLTRRLHVSACGRFAAVVNDYGQYGRVVDLHRSGRTTLRLDGGTNRPDTVPFSAAFARRDGRTVVISRTNWNRLDVHDAETGRLLTDRTPEPAAPDQIPAHELDYFHGRLHVSPDGHWIADDGWVWSPVGLPAVWDLQRWLHGNVWESEDGPSRLRLCQRNYLWDTPMCFIGNDLLAISGIGDDDQLMLEGVRIFSPATGDEVTAFAGPAGALFADRSRLYSAGPDGLQIWDPVTGHRTGSVPGFVPTCHHRGAGQFGAVRDGVLLRWSAG